MIFTFYSYKGGVGRSMALANVAELLNQAGFKVLMIDWDLEAPGLERYFPSLHLTEVLDKPGLMDILLKYKEGMSHELKKDGDLQLDNPSNFMIDVYPGDSGKGKLWLLTAGRRSKTHFAKYARNVLSFDWQEFFQHWEGERYFEWLREEFEAIADIVLIDSRTGVTEIGGICTYHLADTIIMFCTSNQQSIEGTYDMARRFSAPEIEFLRSERPLNTLIIPARIERAEGQFLDEFHQHYMMQFQEFMPYIEGGIERVWQLGIPYIPRYAYQEKVAVRESDRASSQDMVTVFSNLTQVMIQLMQS